MSRATTMENDQQIWHKINLNEIEFAMVNHSNAWEDLWASEYMWELIHDQLHTNKYCEWISIYIYIHM